jgi:hypothetical protein
LLVVEPINGRDKVVEELLRGKVVGEMKWREKYKGEGRTREEDILGLGDIFGLWKGKKIGRGRRRREGNSFGYKNFSYSFS